MRVTWDPAKSEKLKKERGFSFDDALEIFKRAYVIQHKNDDPEQYKAIGFANGQLITLIVEVRHDHIGEHERFVTLWESTKSEKKTYAQNT